MKSRPQCMPAYSLKLIRCVARSTVGTGHLQQLDLSLRPQLSSHTHPQQQSVFFSESLDAVCCMTFRSQRSAEFGGGVRIHQAHLASITHTCKKPQPNHLKHCFWNLLLAVSGQLMTESHPRAQCAFVRAVSLSAIDGLRQPRIRNLLHLNSN